jgi:hypothetical protein
MRWKVLAIAALLSGADALVAGRQSRDRDVTAPSRAGSARCARHLDRWLNSGTLRSRNMV